MSKQCEIIQDLLPLYVDGACSAASEEMVKEHLEDCPACKEMYQKMCSDTSEKMLHSEKENIITHHKRKENQKMIKYIFFAIAVLYIPTLFIVSAFADGEGTFISIPYIFILAVLAIYTLPFYFAFIELGLAVCRALEKKRTTTAEKVFNIIGIVLALSTVLITVIAYTVAELSEMVYLLLATTALLVLKWIVAAIVCKKKPDFEFIKQKMFWVVVVIMALVIAVIAIISTALHENRNVQEMPREMEAGFAFSACETDHERIFDRV